MEGRHFTESMVKCTIREEWRGHHGWNEGGERVG
jgi:hypothetical protein